MSERIYYTLFSLSTGCVALGVECYCHVGCALHTKCVVHVHIHRLRAQMYVLDFDVSLFVRVFVYSNWNVQAIKTNEANYYIVNMSACLLPLCVQVFGIINVSAASQPATIACLYFLMFIFPFGHLIIFIKCIRCRCINYCIRGTIRGNGKMSKQTCEKSVQFSIDIG